MSEKRRSPGPGPEARSWTRVVIEGLSSDGGEVAAFLAELTGTGVEHLPLADGRQPPREQIVGYLGDEALYPSQMKELDRFLRDFRGVDPGAAPVMVSSERLPEEEWQSTWKRHFKAAIVTPRLVVRPPWEDYTPTGEERVIEIDPGMAFGTGLHSSTRLALSFIDDLYQKGTDLFFPEEYEGRIPPPPRSVLDVGTGTAILSMACGLLGARRVTAIDNDPLAVSAAAENIGKNGLDSVIEVEGKALGDVEGLFDLIVANIFHDTLAHLSALLVERLNPYGTLICSGILAGSQVESLKGVFEGDGIRFVEERTENEWAALRFARLPEDSEGRGISRR